MTQFGNKRIGTKGPTKSVATEHPYPYINGATCLIGNLQETVYEFNFHDNLVL